MITFSDNYLQSASINSPYSAFIVVQGGVAPYTFAVSGGVLPNGLQLNTTTGELFGTATQLGVYQFTISVSDSSGPAQTGAQLYSFTVMDMVTLADPTVDQDQFVQQFQSELASSQVWSAGLTTQTSQTLIEYISAVGTLLTAKIVRGVEDAFPETAQSDSAIRAIVNMQGLRLSRMLPAAMQVTIESALAVTIPPYTQWSAGGYSWFNTDVISLIPSVPLNVTLKEGKVVQAQVTGLGTDLQAWVSPEDEFRVSDQDVVVSIGTQDLYKTFGPLWNYQGVRAFSDLTLSDGRLVIQFGSQGYGATPQVSEVVTILYAVTQGATLNGASIAGARVSCDAFPGIEASAFTNPSGGAAIKPVVAYKNFAAGSFGTYASGVTKAQYQSLVNNYPGIVDATTQAQREINPTDYKWMNVIRVAALTTSAWTQTQKQEFIEYMQSVTMYTPHFVWSDPVQIPRDVDIEIYCFNSVNSLSDVEVRARAALTQLFAPRAGLLMTDFYPSDIEQTVLNSSPGQISYVLLKKPTEPMLVTAPSSPALTFQVTASGGTLTPLLYSYAVSVDAPAPSQYLNGVIDASTNPANPTSTVIGSYWVISKDGTVGGVAVVVGDQLLTTAVNTFTVVPESSNGVIDVGVPTRWVYPEVQVGGSQILLDWTTTVTKDVLRYKVWGRKGGTIGILDTLPPEVTAYTDLGGPDPTPEPVAVIADTRIRYNSLGSLSVAAYYATRQQNVLLPVRDSLG